MNKRKNTLDQNQKEIIFSIHKPILLEASAGSGKTTVLVERYNASLISELINQSDILDAVQSIVALTFTRKAASEMKERIREAIGGPFNQNDMEETIKNLIQFNPDQNFSIPELLSEISKQWDRLNEAVVGARVSTIHSFALSILKRFPVESQLDPAVAPAGEDEDGSLQNFRDALMDCIQNFLEKEDPDFTFCVGQIGYKKTREMLEELHFHAENCGIESLQETLQKSGYLISNTELSLDESYRIHCKPILKRMAEIYEESLSEIKREDWKRTIRCSLDKINNFIEIDDCDNLMSWDFSSETSNKSVMEKVEPEYQKLSKEFNRILIHRLWNCYRIIKRHFDEIQKQRFEISFSEIEHSLLLLLRKYPEILKKISEEICYILLDEYQDTSDEQKEILDLILFGSGKRPVPFAVGDPKQSIYGFRNANVRIFSITKKEWSEKPEWKQFGRIDYYLNHNYRSSPQLVEDVNIIFSGLFGKDGSGIGYQKQLPGKQETGGGISFLPEEGIFSGEIFENNCTQAARLIQNLVLIEGFSPGEMLVLIRKKTHFRTLEQIFRKELSEKGIPYYQVDTSDILETTEIRELVIYLQALENSGSNYFLLPLLKSSFFRYSDSRILSLMRNNIKMIDSMEIRNSKEMQIFLELVELKNRYTLSDLTEEVINRTGYRSYLSSMPNKRESLSNLVVFLDHLRKIQNTDKFNLTGFLYNLQEFGLSLRKPQVVGENSNVVRIMTIHSAKGLEAPYVFYLSTSTRHSFHNRIAIEKYGETRRIGLNIAGEDQNFIEIKDAKFHLEKEEDLRLAYVALTRAKKRLFYIGAAESSENKPEARKALSQDGWRDMFCLDIPEVNNRVQLIVTEIPPENRRIEDSEKIKNSLQRKIHYLLENNPLTRNQKMSSVVTVTQLLDIEFSEAGFAKRYLARSFPIEEALVEMAEENDLTQESAERADLGTFLHQVFDKGTPDDYQSRILKSIGLESEMIQKSSEKIIQLAKNYFESDFYREIMSSGMDIYSEWEIITPFNFGEISVQIKGAVDKYLCSPEQGVLLDYKLKIGHKLERYSRQLQYYAYFLINMGFPVTKMFLYDIEKGEALSIPMEIRPVPEYLKMNLKKIADLLERS